MRTVSAAAMAAIDRDTIAGGVPGLELMERAGREMTLELLAQLPELEPPAGVGICCGKGNNGGDGLVLARRLAELGFEVTVMLLAPSEDLSPDARANHDLLPDAVEVRRPDREDWPAAMHALCLEHEVVVDAVFGTGIALPVRDDHAALFAACDRRLATVVALDVPSGVNGDDGAVDPVAVRADLTITVGLPKLGLLQPPGRDHAGAVSVVDIGFPDDVCERHADGPHWLLPEDVASLVPDRPGDTHKYAAGTALLLCGSRRYGGAALLAALGALRSGAGLVTSALPEEHAGAALAFAPEAVLAPLPTGPDGGLAPVPDAVFDALMAKQRAWGTGPGLGDDPDTATWITTALSRATQPVVVDADGLNAFARLDREPAFAADQVVLTPHAGELARLAGVSADDLASRRFELVPELARRWNVVLVAKGAPTLIADPDGFVALNPTGDDALAHGGTGDVLTGLIVGLLGQGLTALDAALLGCWLHGRAGELSAADGSRRAVLAREVADALPEAWAELADHRDEAGAP